MVFICLCSCHSFWTNNKFSESSVKFRKASNCCKRVLEACQTKPNSVLKKCKSAIRPLFNYPQVLSFASDKAKESAKNLSKNSKLDGSDISLSVFPSRTNLKLHNISTKNYLLTPKLVQKVTANFDSTKASGSDCIQMMVLKN